jgi:hypothetical protein
MTLLKSGKWLPAAFLKSSDPNVINVSTKKGIVLWCFKKSKKIPKAFGIKWLRTYDLPSNRVMSSLAGNVGM